MLSDLFNNVEKVDQYSKELNPLGNLEIKKDEKWKRLIPFFELLSSQNCIQILILDLSNNKFVYEVDLREVAGYDPSFYLADNGVNFSFSNIHPDFLYAGIKMQRKVLDFLIPRKEQTEKVTISSDGMYKKRCGEYIHFLQQSVCIETDSNRYPMLMLNYIYDITHLKRTSSANLIIKILDKVNWWNFNFENHCLETVQALSNQEKRILIYLAKGKTSKEIARELFISPFTVDTHRKNLLRKTNCVDTTALVTYARMVGIL